MGETLLVFSLPPQKMKRSILKGRYPGCQWQWMPGGSLSALFKPSKECGRTTLKLTSFYFTASSFRSINCGFPLILVFGAYFYKH